MKLRERKTKDGTLTFFIDYRLDGQRRRQRLAGIHDRKTAEVARIKRVRVIVSLGSSQGSFGRTRHERIGLGKAFGTAHPGTRNCPW